VAVVLVQTGGEKMAIKIGDQVKATAGVETYTGHVAEFRRSGYDRDVQNIGVRLEGTDRVKFFEPGEVEKMTEEDKYKGRLASYLRNIKPGLPGVEQSKYLSGHLMNLEKDEYITWEGDGWQLTKKGQAVIAPGAFRPKVGDKVYYTNTPSSEPIAGTVTRIDEHFVAMVETDAPKDAPPIWDYEYEFQPR
jgi:hypothetical protein